MDELSGSDDRLRKLQRVNEVLMARIERLETSRGSGWSMFQAAVALEKEVLARTRDLERALADLSQRNSELALARAAAEEANRSKTRFLRAASHDLLQPLAAAKLFLGALTDTPMGDTQQELAQRLASAFQSVEELMEAVLEIARLDAQRIEFNRQAVPLGPLFDRLGREHAPQAEAKGLRLRFAPTAAVVDSDPTFLRRITQNLVSNAIKYTRTGGVLIGARPRGDRIWLEVRDSGPGIAAEDRSRIFDEFQRVSSETAEPGMGLGLAIVRRACAKLGHPIQLESRMGEGTIFRVGLPRLDAEGAGMRHDEAAPMDVGDIRSLRGCRAILIENDARLRAAYSLILQDGAGMTVQQAASTAEAEALLAEAAAPRPDVLIADYHLGDGDTGLLSIAALRARRGAVPALLVTAHSGPDLARACAEQGVLLLSKPFSADALQEALLRAISAQR